MPDWPATPFELPHMVLGTAGFTTPAGQAAQIAGVAGGGTAAWPSANRALYIPVTLDVPATVTKMAFEVGTQSGACDVGVYSETGTRLVSSGSTAVGTTGIQVIDLTDTPLQPGVYFLAMCVDNTTATFNRISLNAIYMQLACCQQQAVGAVTLPNPATFANPATSYMPVLSAALAATI